MNIYSKYKWSSIISPLLLVVVISTVIFFKSTVLLLGFMTVTLAIVAFLKLGVYRQLFLFLMLLQLFTFAIKVTYGVANSTILALLPTVFLGAILGSVFLMGVQGKLSVRFSKLDILVISFFILDFIQVFNPYLGALENRDSLIIGLRGFQQRSFLGLVYFSVRWLDITSLRFNTIIRIFTYSIALGSLYALIQQLFEFDLFESAYRLEQIAKDPLLKDQFLLRGMGFLGSPYTFGLVSAIGLVCGTYLFYTVPLSKTEKLLSMVCAVLNGAAVFLSGSRSTYFSLIAMCFILIFVMRTPLMLFAWNARRIVIATMACLILLFITFPDSAPVKYSIERMSSLNEIFASNDSINDNNFKIRRELIAASGPMILANPLGYGAGIFNGGSNPDGLVKVQGYSTFMDNEFVGLALELGIQGVLIFLAIVGIALYRCRMALRSPSCRDRARVLAALLVICPIASIGGQWLAAYPVNIIFWVVLGLIAGLPVNMRSLQYSANHG
jgi:O-antigen ligase